MQDKSGGVHFGKFNTENIQYSRPNPKMLLLGLGRNKRRSPQSLTRIVLCKEHSIIKQESIVYCKCKFEVQHVTIDRPRLIRNHTFCPLLPIFLLLKI